MRSQSRTPTSRDPPVASRSHNQPWTMGTESQRPPRGQGPCTLPPCTCRPAVEAAERPESGTAWTRVPAWREAARLLTGRTAARAWYQAGSKP